MNIETNNCRGCAPKRRIARILKLAALLAATASASMATPANTPVGRITELHGGWNEPNLRIYMDIPQVNPDGCANASGYIIPANIAANAQLNSLALTAYSLKHRVSLVIDGCIYDSPRVIAVHIKE